MRNAAALTDDIVDAIRRALQDSWSEHTQPAFDPRDPSYNQCAQTAIVVFDHFGGDILRTQVCTQSYEIEHFYNRIGWRRYDFTAAQFEIPYFRKPVLYRDTLSNVSEAQDTLQSTQLSAMRRAFNSAIRRHMPANTLLKRPRGE